MPEQLSEEQIAQGDIVRFSRYSTDGESFRQKATVIGLHDGAAWVTWGGDQYETVDASSVSLVSRTPSTSAPDGFVLVPVEPTEDMLESGGNHALYEEQRDDGPNIWRGIGYQAIRETYGAMIASRPTVKETLTVASQDHAPTAETTEHLKARILAPELHREWFDAPLSQKTVDRMKAESDLMIVACANAGNIMMGTQSDAAAETRPQGTVWRHLKRGTLYTEIARANLQQASQFGPVEGDNIVIYRGEDGKIWARAESEFEDGRFEHVASPDTANPTSDEPKPAQWRLTSPMGEVECYDTFEAADFKSRVRFNSAAQIEPLFTSPPSNKELIEALLAVREWNATVGAGGRSWAKVSLMVDAALKAGGDHG